VNDFGFERPTSLAEAVAALRRSPEAKLLAGGQSLLPMLKLELAEPPALISLAGVAELGGIREEKGGLRIGAGVTHAEVAASPEVAARIPALACLAAGIGDAQVRNRGTLGGSVAHADPAADYPAALVGLGATVETDRREIPADAFFTGLFETALAADEIVRAVRFPLPERAAYAKFPNPASKFAVVGVMLVRRGREVRVAVTGAGPVVFRVPAMEAALARDFSTRALEGVTVPEADLLGDPDASPAYRAHLTGVMARRAVAGIA
jgi:carbon-monoxide dehydrogenase medium subunit